MNEFQDDLKSENSLDGNPDEGGFSYADDTSTGSENKLDGWLDGYCGLTPDEGGFSYVMTPQHQWSSCFQILSDYRRCCHP